MKKILLLLSLSLLLFNASGQILFDDNSGGLINGEEWYSFGNSEFDFSYYPVEAFAANPVRDTEDQGYFGIGNAHYAGGREASFGLSGEPGNNFIQVTFSAGSGRYPTSLEVRLRTIDEKLFTAYLYDEKRPDFEIQTIMIPLSEFYRVGNPSQKATATDIAAFSTIQFMFGLAISDVNAGFTIHKAELLKAKTTRTVIYDGSTTALVNGEEWYIYGNEIDVVKQDHPLRLEKVDWISEESYVGVGNARYTSEGPSSFDLSGDPATSFIEVKASGYTNYNSNLDIRLKAGGKEYSYNFNTYEPLDFEDRVFTIPVSELKTLSPPIQSITASALEQAGELGFVFGFANIDYDIFFEVSEVTFVSTEFCVNPDKPVFASELINVCTGGGEVAISIEGELNDADEWYWYTEGCGEALFGQGASILATLNDVSTLYVRGEGSGECELKGECSSVNIAYVAVDLLDFLQVNYKTREVCEESIYEFEVVNEYEGEETVYQWYLNDELYGGASTETAMIFNELQVGDKIKVGMYVDAYICDNEYYLYSEEITMAECGTVTSVFAKAQGIQNASVSGNNLYLQVAVAESYGDIQVTNATGVIIGHASNVNLKEKITVPVVSEDGLIIINLITDKGVYNQKLMVR